MKIKKKFIILMLIIMIYPFSYAENISNRPLSEISLKPLVNKTITSEGLEKYVLEVKDDWGNYLNGSYTLELFNNTTNEKINISPRENFYYFKNGKIEISFQLFKAGINEIIINVDKSRGNSKVEILVDSSKEPYSTNSFNDLNYSFLETVLPLKKGDNPIRIYLKDKYGNEITEGTYSFNVTAEIMNFDGRINEEYFLQNNLLKNSTENKVTGDIIKGKGYLEFVLKISEEMDKNDGLLLTFYLENGIRLNPSLSYFSKEEKDYQGVDIVGFKNELILQIDSNQAKINSFVVHFDSQPKLINGRTMVPLRVISEFLGIKAEWIPEENGVSLVGKGKDLFLKIGKEGSSIKLDSPPIIINSRTYVPLRYISETFNSLVIWDGIEKIITIKN